NVGVEERIKQIIVNLERMKWMPELPVFFIQVNIPSYQLRVIDANKTVLSMKVIVGKTAHKTIIFSDTLKYIVFNPYWNIPSSIIKNEILPAMKKNASYLRRHSMEIIGSSGGYPIIRQRPGDNNALGRIKFLFPNRYNIYLHDTPSKELFGNNKRSFSHGCIRLRRPFALARLLLTTSNGLTPQAFDPLQDSNKEQWITLTKPCPVFITYFTSWADENGIIHFISDIYGHDKKLASHLFK
ncbi:MAG TPA: L,D-transpeptidase family protein, partial [Chitinophagaceae bacterium]|nr:L,D-transpeptidase family protein [Chitinophagaceae bacterium]